MNYYAITLLRSSAPVLTYTSTEPLERGAVVSVPLKSTVKEGVVLSEVELPDFATEEVVSVGDKRYSSEQMAIAKFISEYYFSSFSEAISLFIPFRNEQMRNEKSGVRSDGLHRFAMPLSKSSTHYPLPTTHSKPPALSPEQHQACTQLLHKDKALLFGVTGSGKTEIFISLMFKMLEEGKSSIFLMPEISLTPQMEKRLRVYFGDAVAMWHSKITRKKKEQILSGIENGSIRIIAGARSALFVPLRDLGLIIVDEEHDDSYKAMTRPRYHARDVALLMGQKLGARVVLASATPSVGSYHKMDVVILKRPYIETKKHYRFVSGEGLTPAITAAVEANFKAGNQSLVFLPTRGNFKYLYCPGCGTTHRCPFCSVGMALHRRGRHLKCHYCNYTEPIRESCLACGYAPLSSERMGTVEAIEQLEEAIPGIRIEQFDKDSITTATRLKQALKRFESGESQVLLGTQMLSKGHDYADITLSVILGLDYISGLADYRARERAMSLLFQIAGRSGRAREAEVIIQTGDPEFYRPYLGDYERFLTEEITFRQTAGYPPFASLARILIAHKEETKAAKLTLDTVTQLQAFETIEIIGHGKAPIERIADKYRFVILLRSKKRVPLLKALHAVNRREIEVDMDPVEFS